MEILEETLHLDTSIEVNENLCFNTELFESCKQGPHINTLLEGYGKAVTNHPVLIDIRQIHDLGYIAHKYDKELDRPRGFQTRADDKDQDTIDSIAKDMLDKKWDHLLMQGAVFRLPKEFQGMSFSSDGVERIYGIANLTHRLYAARLAGQTHILAWVIDITISNLIKWATAEANRNLYSSNPRKDSDIINSILRQLQEPNSDISVAIANAPTPEKEEEAMLEEVESYHVHAKTRDAIVRRLGHRGGFTPERKKWDSAFMKEHVEVTFQEWVKSSSRIYDYISNNDIPIILSQDEGSGVEEVASKWAEHVLDKNGPLKVLFSLKKSGKIDAMKADEMRRMFIQKVGNHMKMMGEAYQMIYVDNLGTLPMYEAFPEFAGETKMIKLY